MQQNLNLAMVADQVEPCPCCGVGAKRIGTKNGRPLFRCECCVLEFELLKPPVERGPA